MDTSLFINSIQDHGINFFTGVPDSFLRPLCDTLTSKYGYLSGPHIIAENEGGAVALATGHYLGTGTPACVYLQNSGLGNAVNPVCSLTSPKVYAIPMVFIVGWRGEPGLKDEPQHIFQGEVTEKQLELLGIKHVIIDKDTTPDKLADYWSSFLPLLNQGKSVAFLMRKGALSNGICYNHVSDYPMTREQVINEITKDRKEDVFISTTGKASRELFEAREARGEGHGRDFLTVGSMGHSSLIALGVAASRPEKRVWCIDGDGAALMHLGSLAVVGSQKPNNFIHVVINNQAHESVGGMPTIAGTIDIPAIASACGYCAAFKAENSEQLQTALKTITQSSYSGPVMLEIMTDISAREDLGRPTTTPVQNRDDFMNFLGVMPKEIL